MKRTILLLLAATTVMSYLYAQTTKNPFSKMGYKKHITYTSSKGEFEEFHKNADVVEIGSVYFNTKTKKVVGYLNEEKENAEVATATSAMSVDPLCEKYYWISPYAYCLNNPVKFVDPTGMAAEKPIDLFDESDSKTLRDVPKNADYKVGDGQFTVYGHANSRGLQYTDAQGNKQLANTPEKIVTVLSERSPEFKAAMAEKKEISLTIYGCNTASKEYVGHDGKTIIKNPDPIAEKLSAAKENITVTGANGYVNYSTNFWGTPKVVGVSNQTNDGSMITYKNGTVVKTENVNYVAPPTTNNNEKKDEKTQN